MKIDWSSLKDSIVGVLQLALAIALGGAGIGLLLGCMYTVLSWFGL